MIDEVKLRKVFDAHLDKRLSTKSVESIVQEILVIAGNKKRIANKGSRMATVAVPNPDGSVSARQVNASPHSCSMPGHIVIGHPKADED